MIATWGQLSWTQLLPLTHPTHPQPRACDNYIDVRRAHAHASTSGSAYAPKHTQTQTLKQPSRLYLYKQRLCWSCEADLLFSVWASFLLPVVLNNSCPAPVDLSFPAAVSLLPSLSHSPAFVILVSLPAAVLFSHCLSLCLPFAMSHYQRGEAKNASLLFLPLFLSSFP